MNVPVSQLVQVKPPASASHGDTCELLHRSTSVWWLQGITIAWMLVECGVSLFAAASAHSPAMLAFGSDSLIELLSATVVLLQFAPRFAISQQRANRAASLLLLALAIVVAVTASLSMALCVLPETSIAGIGITVAALIVMPVLGWMKRREARKSNDAALAADAVQSATCAYLAAITLAGLAVNAIFHVAWFDSAVALLALPLLLWESRKAWQGKACGCC